MSAQTDDENRSFLGKVADVARSWGPAILAVLMIRTFVFEPFRIPSGSMIPTLLVGDQVVVNKSSYGLWVPPTGVEIPFLDMFVVLPRYELLDLGDPERGDIIVFRFPKDERQNYIKRVVGLPGDRIAVKDNRVVVNGEVQEMVYKAKHDFVDGQCDVNKARLHVEDLGGVKHETLTWALRTGGLANKGEVQVPEGSVFVMGDNRDFSLDSRAWGFVREDQIKGKAHLVWFSWDSCTDSTVGGLRMDRSFHNLYTMIFAPAE